MSAIHVQRATGGQQTFGVDKLPLTVGPGGAAMLQVPGPGGADVVATIDNLDGDWLLQPASGVDGLTVNGIALGRATRLAAGDSIEYFGATLTVAASDNDTLSLSLAVASSDYITAPPVETAAGADDDDEIESTVFTRAATDVAPPPPRRARWPFAVGAALALLGTVGAVLFTAQSVRFDTVPAEMADVRLSGGWFKLKVGDRYLLRPGNHAVRLSTPGYYDYVQKFELADKPLTLRAELEPLPGRLRLAAQTETTATVSLDGTVLGELPLDLADVAAGVYDVTIDAPLYLPWRGRLEVTGRDQLLEIVADLVPTFGRVDIQTEPAGALVTLGELELGTAAGIVRVPEGRQALTLLLAGYKPERVVVDVLAGGDHHVEPIVLEPADGQLSVRSRPAGANVTVDGQYRGQTPIDIALSPDVEYVVQLSKAGYGRTSRVVTLSSAEGEDLFVDLSARSGVISLDVRPVDAVVLVNGQRRGNGSRELRLPAAPQRITVQRDGYVEWTDTITPRPGFPQRVAVRLKTLNQERLSKISATLTSSQGPVLRYVDAGEFTMGASRREPGRRANETLRQVVLTRPYYLGTREITNREYRLFNPKHESITSREQPLILAADSNPVINVSWQQAAAYCNWLSEKDGLDPVYEEKFDKLVPIRPTPNGYRLPTEAEWAWAARFQAGQAYLKFPWGERDTPPRKPMGNFADQSASKLVPTVLPGYDDAFPATAPVASFRPNQAGFYDLSGNVAEWVHDFYQVYTPDSTRVYTDPEGPEQARFNVIRGSSWRHATQTTLRLSYRDFGNSARQDVGFRIARNAPGASAATE
ncbi:MAG: SUMF1/EgtB/PvdO family nonheme iron enzyme [Pseudomonadota bacterium]